LTGATAVLGTRHGKERVIAPILETELGLRVEVLATLDTDRFGTFTREVPRAGSFREAARAKAQAALAEHGRAEFGLASEGSFGPHPVIPFVPGGIEMVLLIDRAAKLELTGMDVTIETNFDHCEVANLTDALAFAAQAKFPAHGLIVMACRDGQPVAERIVKGITDPPAFQQAVGEELAKHGRAWIETDMRAHLNPTRMRSIERATRSLVANVRSECPACRRPGYIVVEHVRGLPCADCGLPTQRPQAEVLVCAGCGHREERPLAGVTTASPGECGWCNP